MWLGKQAFILLLILHCFATASAGELIVEDIFGRRLNEHGLTLVDWEGPIANPAIKFFVVPPPDTAYPARAVLTSTEPRVYFDLPSEIDPRGPRKVMNFEKSEKFPAFASIFSNSKKDDHDFVIELRFRDDQAREQALKLPCHVINQDKKEPKPFPITVDFSRDRTGLFKDEKARQLVTQAARDWTYFFEPVPLDPVPAGNEHTFIWDADGFKSGHLVVNSFAYTGYLLYAYGIHSAALRSGGEPSRTGAFQWHNGRSLPIHRSGGLEIEINGNYNSKGWLVSLDDDDFWKATNLNAGQNDLYSIAHHEIGHSLIFNPANPLFDRAKKTGQFRDAAIRAYLGKDLQIDSADHLPGALDSASRRGAFGNEYHGDMPQCRWQITKLDLLCAKAVGYPLRKTSAFTPLQLLTSTLAAGVQGKNYAEKLQATGGIPFYNWEITDGLLPPGLHLDSFEGAISGTPVKAGIFQFTVRVRDYDEKPLPLTRKLRVDIKPD
jgi:hypothetical protein